MTKPLVIGHKGSPHVFPENTLPSFEFAIQQGADMIELDLQESSDGHLVVFHDYDMKRLLGHEGNIVEMSLDELKEFDLGKGARIPTLNEVLRAVRGRIKVNIELKVSGIELETLTIVNELGVIDDILFSSFYHGILSTIKDLDERAQVGVLYNSPLEDPSSYALEFRASAINPYFSLLKPDIIVDAHKDGLKVYPWTVNDRNKIEELLNMRVDGIITDLPALCRELVDLLVMK